MMTSDFHMHTNFSTDCQTPVRVMIEGAISKGLKTICFTDHDDRDYPVHEDTGIVEFSFETEEYFRVMQQMQMEYREKIEILIGVEIGLQPHLNQYYQELTQKYPFDFVIGSLHVIQGEDPYYGAIFEGKNDVEVYRENFIDTIRCLKSIEDFDVLGHIDYVVRYGKNREKEYSYKRYADYIDEILRLVIDKGKGIELNMSGFKYGLGFPHPHPDVIRRYRELGGEIITVGADGHRPEHIAYEFQNVSSVLRACGFEYYTEFRGRKPIFKQLP